MTNSSSSGQIDFNLWVYRLIAYVIDSIITGVVASIIYYAILLPSLTPKYYNVFIGNYYGSAPIWAFWLLYPLILGIIQIIYFVILEVYWGATLGKRILGMQVQLTKGGKVTIDKSFIRNISKILWPLVIIDWLIAILTPGPDKRQKFTDRIAGTTVVQIKQVFQLNALTTPSTPPTPPPPPPPT
jgi:uncharacterized RDD family membrane protein YckC